MKSLYFSEKRRQKTIFISSLISLIFSLVGIVRSLFYYEYKYFYGFGPFELKFGVADTLDSIPLYLLISGVIPTVLLFLYICRYYKKKMQSTLVPIALSFVSISYFLYSEQANDITYIWKNFIYLAIALAFLGAAITVFTGCATKICLGFLIPSVSLGSLIELISVFDMIGYIRSNQIFFAVLTPVISIGRIALYVSLFVLLVLNKEIIPSMAYEIKPRTGNFFRSTRSRHTNTDSLALLKEKYDLGLITEEEYQRKRAELISKL